MCRRWKFDQKLKIWTWLHKMTFSCRIMKKHVSIECEMYFMRFKWKCVNAILGGWVGLMEFDERQVFKFGGKMLWVEKTSESGWEVWVLILIKFFSLEKLGWNGKTWKLEAKSSFLSKTQVNSHSRLLSLSPKLNGAKEVHRVENRGLYIWG